MKLIRINGQRGEAGFLFKIGKFISLFDFADWKRSWGNEKYEEGVVEKNFTFGPFQIMKLRHYGKGEFITDYRKVKAGMKFIWIGGNGRFERGDLAEVMRIVSGTRHCYIKDFRTGDTREWVLDDDLKFKLWLEEKPHDYSPVMMTGRYRTIGD